MSKVLYRSHSQDALYVRVDVVWKIIQLLRDQRTFFHTRDKRLLQSCKEREDAILKWADETERLMKQFGDM